MVHPCSSICRIRSSRFIGNADWLADHLLTNQVFFSQDAIRFENQVDCLFEILSCFVEGRLGYFPGNSSTNPMYPSGKLRNTAVSWIGLGIVDIS